MHAIDYNSSIRLFYSNFIGGSDKKRSHSRRHAKSQQLSLRKLRHVPRLTNAQVSNYKLTYCSNAQKAYNRNRLFRTANQFTVKYRQIQILIQSPKDLWHKASNDNSYAAILYYSDLILNALLFTYTGNAISVQPKPQIPSLLSKAKY